MNDKLLLPWKSPAEMHYGYHYYLRHNLRGTVVAQVYYSPGSREYAYTTPDVSSHHGRGYWDTAVAMEECDEKLVEFGYTLLTEERAKKLEVLL